MPYKYKREQRAYSKRPYVKARLAEAQQKFRQRLKAKVHALLGGKCARCGISDSRVLQIDHINGGGRKERREYKTTNAYYHYLSQGLDTGKYQLLCANCNWIKRFEMNEHPRRRN